MQCDDVQKELALARSGAELTGLIRRHLDSCADCRAASALYDRLNVALADTEWELPAGFAVRVANLAQPLPQRAGTSVAAGMLSGLASILMAAVCILSYLVTNSSRSILTAFGAGLRFVALNALTVAAISAAAILFATLWLTRRLLAE
jgi:hypothetical protein